MRIALYSYVDLFWEIARSSLCPRFPTKICQKMVDVTEDGGVLFGALVEVADTGKRPHGEAWGVLR